MPSEVLNVFMRWLHISSVTVLIGGFIYARMVMEVSVDRVSNEVRSKLIEKAAGRFRPMAVAAMIALILSGIYNLMYSPGHTRRYDILLGIKLLLVAHIFSTAILVTQPEHPRRRRLMTGAAISGLIVIAISAWLRRNY
jgi:uncharacterized membrane protein